MWAFRLRRVWLRSASWATPTTSSTTLSWLSVTRAEIWFDRDPGGPRLKIAVASCGDPPRGPGVDEAKRILAGRGLLDGVDFRYASVTRSELDAAVERVQEALAPLAGQAYAAPDHAGPEARVRIDTVTDLNAEQLAILDAAAQTAAIPTVVDPCLGAGENTPRLPLPLKQVAWALLNVSEDGGSLLIQYYWGGDYVNEPAVSVEESDEEIAITVALPDLTKSLRGNAILLFAAESRLVVELAAPVAGRRITGPERAFLDHPGAARYTSDDGSLQLVPRVLGLTPEDARWVLRAQRFRAELPGHGARIVSQQPEPDQIAAGQDEPTHGTVTLIAGD